MKKAFSLLLVLLACFALASCRRSFAKPQDLYEPTELKRVLNLGGIKGEELKTDGTKDVVFTINKLLKIGDKYYDLLTRNEFVIEGKTDDYDLLFKENYIVLKPVIGKEIDYKINSYIDGKTILTLPYATNYNFRDSTILKENTLLYCFDENKLVKDFDPNAYIQSTCYIDGDKVIIGDRTRFQKVDVIYNPEGYDVMLHSLNNGNLVIIYKRKVSEEATYGYSDYTYRFENERYHIILKYYNLKTRQLLDLEANYIINNNNVEGAVRSSLLKNKTIVSYRGIDHKSKKLTELKLGIISDENPQEIFELTNYGGVVEAISKDLFVVKNDDLMTIYNQNGRLLYAINISDTILTVNEYGVHTFKNFTDYNRHNEYVLKNEISGEEIVRGIFAYKHNKENKIGEGIRGSNTYVVKDSKDNKWKIFCPETYTQTKQLINFDGELTNNVCVDEQFVYSIKEDGKYDVFNLDGKLIAENCDEVDTYTYTSPNKVSYSLLKVKKVVDGTNTFKFFVYESSRR